ncbi:MAG TPA: hypothetical protein VF813_09335, partial [Anaerolineaceae bacterium]
MAFNPGPVSARSASPQTIRGYTSHADFETRCELCHQPLKSGQAILCLTCHTAVAQEIADRSGLHARLGTISQCASCHPEHQGRGFDPTQFALSSFDHNASGFPLLGKHAQVGCADCHKQGQYARTATTCAGCHSDPVEHAGVFGNDCAACHTVQGWKPAVIQGTTFDHAATSFSLARHTRDYAGRPMQCTACHAQAEKALSTAACVTCHAQKDAMFTAGHTRQYGSACLDCHDGTDRMRGFQHSQVFVLDGKHAALECSACHADNRFKGT